MDLNLKCNNANLLTSNGVGIVKVIGNVNVTGAKTTDGDILIEGDSIVNSNYSVNGTSNWNSSATIEVPSSLTIPAIYSNNVFQTQPVSHVQNGTLTFDSNNNAATGTNYFIQTGGFLNFSLGNQNIGSNYKAIVSNTSNTSGQLQFVSSTPINWTITGGNITLSGNVSDPRAYDILVIAIMQNSQINFSTGVDVYRGTGNLLFNNSHLTIGDTFDFTYDGTKWLLNVYLSNFSALALV
jgi:hypothetical protein